MSCFLMWVTLNKLPLLKGLEQETKTHLLKKANDLNLVVYELEIKKGFLEMTFANPENHPIRTIVYQLKGYSSKMLRENHPTLKEHKHLWNSGYYFENG